MGQGLIGGVLWGALAAGVGLVVASQVAAPPGQAGRDMPAEVAADSPATAPATQPAPATGTAVATADPVPQIPVPAASPAPDPAPPVPQLAAAPPPDVAPVLPATPSELSFLASSERRQNPEDVAARGEDVVVGEVTQQFSINGGAIQGDGFKVGFRKAHEEIRARQRTVREFIKPVYRQPAETRSESNDEIVIFLSIFCSMFCSCFLLGNGYRCSSVTANVVLYLYNANTFL